MSYSVICKCNKREGHNERNPQKKKDIHLQHISVHKMSASERRGELLRHKAALEAEQARLRGLLREQDKQLRVGSGLPFLSLWGPKRSNLAL